MSPLEIVADAMRSAGEVGFMPWDQLPEVAREQYLEAARARIAELEAESAEQRVAIKIAIIEHQNTVTELQAKIAELEAENKK